ncbi:DUF262 domain-containing protein [Mariprofundus ferrooxydans]|uniref:DUF262 domain-containing protein n=1 Tax=Mariprofundus ferrooxydans PV-1 TaxID=314345 RepID=Q0EXK0_9PROT|nr:DUF262 domain-containing protein [Mariprofundus ferrooxydans]EAU54047.1 hypothetical protein SPV1_03383 [Mariprofundus ferrooxydans PV-1]KON46604.1 hypothetical protein AL013_12495 [Mariprofundus ferrooxydans]
MGKLENKIEANDRTVLEVLDNKKYTVDYFQREYSWQQKHIEQLVTDLTSAFLSEYDSSHERKEVANYNSYYLGPFVLSEKGGKRSIIDGQQRLTSLTLFMIYLKNLERDYGLVLKLDDMIYSEKFGSKSFNITVEERIPCLDSLFNQGAYTPNNGDDESTRNMAARYEDIEPAFPKEIDQTSLPYFIDWMKERVVLVEIVAYSDDNAYTIFETMNDRGMNLTSTEMLKGFVLSRFKENEVRQKANDLWKESIQQLHCFDKDEDQRFFQAWLRAKYAESIRPGSAGSKNEDFEKIGTRFHSWVRENLELLKLSDNSQSGFDTFVNEDFTFFRDAYLKIRQAEESLSPALEHVYYIQQWGIANSLSYPLMLAPLVKSDTPEMVDQKINLVAKYIETFVVRRSVNFKKFSASSIRYTMYTLVKEIRSKPLDELKEILTQKLNDMGQTWNGLDVFRLHGQNRRFVKFLLSRISAFIDKNAGRNETFETYYFSPGGKPFEVEHIWGNKFEEHTDEFEQKGDFDEYRNRLGGLVLLPRGANQSYGAKPYSEKMKHYIKENLFVQTLCPLTYQNNPNFLRMKETLGLPFEPHEQFKQADIIKRQELYRKICETVWAF